MKFLFQLLFCSTILFLGFNFTACESSPKVKIVKQTDKSAKEYTSAYTCPMKCVGSGSDKPGKCPACKMDYTANETKAPAHDHGSHEGHDHGSHEGHDHGSHEGHDHGSHEGHNH